MPSTSQAPSTAAPTTHSHTAVQIAIMAIAAFVIVTTEFLIIGLLPALARDLNVSVTLAGQLVTLFAFTVMLFGPILTARLAHIDRRKLFTCILLVFAASNALAAVSANIWILAIARFIPALLLPVFWGTASETAGQLAGPANAGKAVANVYMGISAALVFGIPLGTLAADAIGWRGTFWMLAALCLLIAALMRSSMPTLPAAPQRKQGEKQTLIFKDPRFIAQVALSVLTFTAMFTAYTYLADGLWGRRHARQSHRRTPGRSQPIGFECGISRVTRCRHAGRHATGDTAHRLDGRVGCVGHCVYGPVPHLPGPGHASRRQGSGIGRDDEHFGR